MSFGARALGLALLGLALLLGRRWSRRRARAAAMAGLALAVSCSSPGTGTYRASLSGTTTTFLHTGFAAGPTVFTGADGHLLEERRYEPFGVPVDAKFHIATGDTVGAPDLAARDLNELNKRTEATTGWSDHGARWMAPETGRWLSTDPPVAAPDDTFMFAPWALHPYQYVHQNPVIYWDPDGRLVWFVAILVVAVLVETEGAANAPTPTTPPERIIPSPTNADIAWGAAKVSLSAAGGAGVSGLVGGTLAKGALAGGASAMIGQGVDDVHHGQFSGVGTYAEQAFYGAAAGVAFAGVEKAVGCPTVASEGSPTVAEKPTPVRRAGAMFGRSGNRLTPDPAADGPHTTFKRHPQTGKVTGHAEWKPNPHNPSGFDQAKRVDVAGSPHFNNVTGQDVPTPHVHETAAPGGVRSARPDEVPQ